MILHKFSRSPFSQTNFAGALKRVSADDGVILTQDAIYTLKSNEICQQVIQQTTKVFALEADCIARGIEANEHNIQRINYAEFVSLTLKYENVISW